MGNQSANGTIKRLPGGTVDFDYYEERARQLRRETWKAFGHSAAETLRRLWAPVAADFVLTKR